MANTPAGIELQDYLNSEIKRRGIEASATVVEGQDNMDLGVHIRGSVADHFVLKDAYGAGLSAAVKNEIAKHLDRLKPK